MIKFLLVFRQSGDVLSFLYARRLCGYTATGGFQTMQKSVFANVGRHWETVACEKRITKRCRVDSKRVKWLPNDSTLWKVVHTIQELRVLLDFSNDDHVDMINSDTDETFIGKRNAFGCFCHTQFKARPLVVEDDKINCRHKNYLWKPYLKKINEKLMKINGKQWKLAKISQNFIKIN